ncbi:MAGE-domain-containing protein [Saccharata proteae CBS 121410]|uniref:MAGE-domain-containing protein n=1 Tax=Saccharata proteae CBS 121410 TaxID=1314787 RepID=A0A9P4I2J5_9PEZI|nr:MAGE-domain-containing protein [Saccharata proteae CBS 121410]
MPLVQRKRRAPSDEEGSDVEETPARTQQTRRRRASPESVGEDYVERENDTGLRATGSLQQMQKKLVRLALACEYSRTPIRRKDITDKVLGPHKNQFRPVFAEAQRTLEAVFGMQMEELPVRDKITLQQRRAAQKNEKQATSSSSWVLVSTLPKAFKHPAIINPPKAPSTALESSYVGIYTFIITVIVLSGGELHESKLERLLRRMQADVSTPVGKTDQVINRLCKDGYIVKVKDSSSGAEEVKFVIGPRGKVEVGADGAAGMVRAVYGDAADEDLERRLNRSLLMAKKDTPKDKGDKNGEGAKKPRGRPPKATQQQAQEAEDSESD